MSDSRSLGQVLIIWVHWAAQSNRNCAIAAAQIAAVSLPFFVLAWVVGSLR